MDTTDRWIVAGLGVIVAIVIGAVVWAIVTSPAGSACPHGQVLTVTSYVPVKAGSVTVMDPIYGCEAR